MKKQNNNILENLSSNQLDRLFFSDLPVGILILDKDYTVLKANKTMYEYFGKRHDEDIPLKKFGNIFDCRYAHDKSLECGTGQYCQVCPIRKGTASVLEKGLTIKGVELKHEFYYRGRSSEKWFSLNASRFIKDDEKYLIATFTDITKNKIKEKELISLGVTDALTGAYNRRQLLSELDAKLRELKSGTGKTFCAVMLDIDDFKEVNDTFGHLVGDEVLKSLTNILSDDMRAGDFVGRYGGEEFFLMIDLPLGEAKKVIARVMNRFSKDTEKTIGRQITFSTGIYQADKNNVQGMNIEDVIKKCDDLLYKAKQNGKNTIEAM